MKYDAHYRDAPAACGAPFHEFVAFCESADPGSVLDLGCGQGRDALMFARAGHTVLGVDASSVGVGQMVATAATEGLALEGVVDDVVGYRPSRTFDVVILDRVLHMLVEADRETVLSTGLDAVGLGGHVLVAEGPKGLVPVREAVVARGWTPTKSTKNRLIARRPPA